MSSERPTRRPPLIRAWTPEEDAALLEMLHQGKAAGQHSGEVQAVHRRDLPAKDDATTRRRLYRTEALDRVALDNCHDDTPSQRNLNNWEAFWHMSNVPFRDPTFLSAQPRENLHRGTGWQMQPLSPLACTTGNTPSNCRRGFSNSCRLPFMFVTGRAGSSIQPPRCRTMGSVAYTWRSQ